MTCISHSVDFCKFYVNLMSSNALTVVIYISLTLLPTRLKRDLKFCPEMDLCNSPFFIPMTSVL